MTLRHHHQSPNKRAFTLIEILVATTVMIIMVGLVIQITSQVLNVWNRSTGKLAANAEARIAMDLITSDLETAVFRNDGLQWLRAEERTASGPGGIDTVALRLFAPALDRPDGPGDVCAIAYQLENRDPVDGATSSGTPDDRLWILYRLVVNPEDTFKNLMGDPNQTSLPDLNAATWSGGSISASIIDGGNNYLARNVVEFDLDFYVQDDGNTSTPSSANRVTVNTIYGGTGATVGAGAGSAFNRPLAYVDIKLTIVSDEGASLLQNVARVKEAVESVPQAEQRIIRQHGEVFTSRVYFPAQPL